MRLYLTIIALVLTGISHSYAQACGGSIHSVKVYVLNEQKLLDVKYEVVPIKSPLKNILGDNKEDSDYYSQINQGLIIDSTAAQAAIEREKVGLKNNPVKHMKSSNSLEYGDSMMKGRITGGEISFKTYENAYRPCILKITNNGFSTYILANFFGGCYKQSNLLITTIIAQDSNGKRPYTYSQLFNSTY